MAKQVSLLKYKNKLDEERHLGFIGKDINVYWPKENTNLFETKHYDITKRDTLIKNQELEDFVYNIRRGNIDEIKTFCKMT